MGGNTSNKSLSYAPSVFTINYHIHLMGGSDLELCSCVYTVSSRITGTILEQIKMSKMKYGNNLSGGVLCPFILEHSFKSLDVWIILFKNMF